MTVMNPARMATGAAAGSDFPSSPKAHAAHDRSGFDDLLQRMPARRDAPGSASPIGDRQVSRAGDRPAGRPGRVASTAEPSRRASPGGEPRAAAGAPQARGGQATAEKDRADGVPEDAGLPSADPSAEGVVALLLPPAPARGGDRAARAGDGEDPEEDRPEEQPASADPGLAWMPPVRMPPPAASPRFCEISQNAGGTASAHALSTVASFEAGPVSPSGAPARDPGTIAEARGPHPAGSDAPPAQAGPGGSIPNGSVPGEAVPSGALQAAVAAVPVPPATVGGVTDPQRPPSPPVPAAEGQGGRADPVASVAGAPASAAQPILPAGPHLPAADPARQVAMRL